MFENYRVTGKRSIVDAITQALEHCGVQVTRDPDFKSAPFEYEIRLPGGDHISLVCYAFLANKYSQAGRPIDEHRFQIKYGSDFKRAHEIFVDPKREVITLFLGVHLEEGVFVGLDPVMHNPTWFSSSVEFKTRHVSEAKRSGWFGWERERSSGRRRTGREAANYQTEAVIAFGPQNLLRYIQFERLGTGLDAGERLLLADNVIAGDVDRALEHPLEVQFGLTAQEILDVVAARFRLEVAVKGGVAEHHLGKFLRARPAISSVVDIDEDGRPDFELTCQGNTYLVECKNVLKKIRPDGVPRVDFQKTRAAKGDPCSRYYDPKAFNILAACLHPATRHWEFRFASTSVLDPHEKCDGKLSHKVLVHGNRWKTNIEELLV